MPVLFTLNVPDAATQTRIVDALCAVNGYSPVLADGSPNPQTKPQFARQQIMASIIQTVRNYEQSLLAPPAAPTVT